MNIVRFGPPLAAAVLALSGLAAPSGAWAQDVPSYAQPSGDETIRGRIVAIDGAYALELRDVRGFIDNVELHQGTIINPTGLSLATGMSVTIIGYNQGSSFAANEIDTPYRYAGPVPVPVYLGPGWWYPGYGYGYGPSFSLSLVFGVGGYSFVHGPFYGRPWAWNGHVWSQRAYPIAHAYRYPSGAAWHSFETARAGSSRGFATLPRTMRAPVAEGRGRGYSGRTYAGRTYTAQRSYGSRGGEGHARR